MRSRVAPWLSLLFLLSAGSCIRGSSEPDTDTEPTPTDALTVSGGSVTTEAHRSCAIQEPGSGGFIDGLPDSGLSFVARTNDMGLGADGVVAADLDNDGCADLVFTQMDGPGEVYWNRCAGDGSVGFEPGNGGAGIFPSHGALSPAISSADVDGDGWLDLLLLPYAPGRLLLNNHDRTFRDASASYGLFSQSGYTPGATWADVDGDGDLDLLVLRATDCVTSNGWDCAEVCSDGSDNNDNGLVDCDDPQCEDSSWCAAEEAPGEDRSEARSDDDDSAGCDPQGNLFESDCDNGIDDDCDGLSDCDDTVDCSLHTACDPGPGPDPPATEEGACSSGPCPECSDGLDNDSDGLVDCEEPSCTPWCHNTSDLAPCCQDIPPTCADPNKECSEEGGVVSDLSLLPNQLWLNEGGERFVQVTEGGPVEGPGHTLHAAWHDFDGDSDPDLLELNDEGEIHNSRLWENLGPDLNGTLQWQERLEESGIGLLRRPMGVLISDLDEDGLPDLWISEVNEVRVFRNFGGLQQDGSYLWSFADVGRTTWLDTQEHRPGDISWSVLRLDTQGDGRAEVFVSYGWVLGFDEQLGLVQQADRVFANNATVGDTPSFRSVPDMLPVAAAHATGSAIADFNRDGVPDIISRNSSGPPALYIGKCTDSHRLVLRLQDPDSLNYFGIGARVELTIGGQIQVQEMAGGGKGSFSASQPALYFGTGSAEQIDRLRVSWPGPGGRETVVSGLCAHCLVTVSP